MTHKPWVCAASLQLDLFCPNPRQLLSRPCAAPHVSSRPSTWIGVTCGHFFQRQSGEDSLSETFSLCCAQKQKKAPSCAHHTAHMITTTPQRLKKRGRAVTPESLAGTQRQRKNESSWSGKLRLEDLITFPCLVGPVTIATNVSRRTRPDSNTTPPPPPSSLKRASGPKPWLSTAPQLAKATLVLYSSRWTGPKVLACAWRNS